MTFLLPFILYLDWQQSAVPSYRDGARSKNLGGQVEMWGYDLPPLVEIGSKFIYSEKATKFCEIFT